MSGIEEMREGLARIHITLKASPERVEEITEEILEVGRSAGLNPEKRAEGYALMPSREMAVMGLPHLRVAIMEEILTIWVRAPYSLDEERCEGAGISAGELYEMLLAAAVKMAEILRKHSAKDEFLQVSLP